MVYNKSNNLFNQLLSGQPIIFAEGQFVACQSSTSNTAQYSPQRPVKMSRLCHILSLEMVTPSSATLNSDTESNSTKTSFDEYEMQSLPQNKRGMRSVNSIGSEETDRQKRKHFKNIILWVTGAGHDSVYMETFSDISDVVLLVNVIRTVNSPVLITLMARRCGPLTVSLSSIVLDMQCLTFCMFQT